LAFAQSPNAVVTAWRKARQTPDKETKFKPVRIKQDVVVNLEIGLAAAERN
jgi:hypothetical protein